ncbi:outer membrane lipoprotein carrier protein LolA [Dyadobacter psychrotolerans]|uniref:Outer membrane lipoprotein carrier protein LolA n=1 Tax=Dyadobacter psychrotolerans TaxID=2541721 RepID=A0A4V2Z2V4_9BACT|nr:outer membrane lipoprotein carrier protein LolA [Dyadobacter psychrotolerans]TDE10278.1 outer membrane lipoprotein carrier protein LolA [Dyadobacter psychrotolerans]
MLKYKLIFAILVLVGQTGFAQVYKAVADPAKVLSELKKSSAAANTIQADFKEEKYLAVLKDPEKSSGIFYYKKNDKMRWEQQQPFKYVILINGDKLRVQDAGKEKNVGSAGRMAGQIKELMIGLVNGDFQDNKAFKQSFAENGELYQVTLLPVSKRLKNVYSKITLVFPKSTLRLKELTFFEKGGDKSIMRFQNERINQPIAESLFVNL